MKFIIGEGAINMIERMGYRGAVGLFFSNTLGGVRSYLIFGLVCIFTVVGFITVMSWLLSGSIKKWKETPGEYWRRTGRMK